MTKNKGIFLALGLLFTLGTLIFAGGPMRRKLIDPSQPPKPYADGEVLIKFKRGMDQTAVNNFAASRSLALKKRFGFLSKSKGQEIVLLKSTTGMDAEVLAKALSLNANVEYATPNYFRQLAATPNDTNYSSLWGMNNTGQTGGTTDADIDAPEAWDISTGSASVIVADIDTGLDYNHPDLAANCWKNPNEIAGNGIDDDGNGYIDDVYGIDPCGTVYANNVPDTDPMDGYGHGTHTAGTIGARGNNLRGVVGVNWNVKIMGLKFFDDIGDGGADADSIECIQYAVYQKTHGQNVVAINASWGGPGTDSGALRDAIEFANNAGIVFCASAGNGGTDGIGDNNDAAGGGNHQYPSDYTLPGIIAVAATDHNDALGSFSNYGATSIDVGAPGVGVLSTVPGRYIPAAGDIFFDDMEGGAGKWTTGGTNNTWSISENQEGWLNATFPPPSPTHFWSDSPGANYVNGTDSWVMNNSNINLSGYVGQKVYLSFGAAWGLNTGDHALVQISANGGSTWTTLYDQTYDGYIYYWSRYQVLIPDANKTSQVRIRFRLTSNSDGANYWGFLIDDVGIGTLITYSYESWNGTSMACPHVAGAVAYLASIFPSETVAQRKSRILNGGDSKASLSGRTVTGRRLNLFGAYSYTPPASNSITVTSPNGGEVWVIGSSHNITWTWTGTFSSVELHYSLNSGASWSAIDPNDPNDGTFSWTVPTVTPSANCLVRVRERTSDNPSDTSNAVFAIVASSAETVTTPTTPTGPAAGTVGGTYAYSTGGSTSSSGHSVQYRFDWGDGTFSSWLTAGTTSTSHIWSAAGTYNVRAMARCSTHFIQSAWSPSLPVILGDTPTWVAVSGFAASESEAQPTVEWHTASEMGPVAFNLWRRDKVTKEYELVNASLLPSLPSSPQGGSYRLADPGAQYGEPVTYRLEEVDSLGRTRAYGPFTITFGAAPSQLETEIAPGIQGREEPSAIDGYQRFSRGRSSYEQQRLKTRQQGQRAGAVLAVAQTKERARITVKGRGLFYVSSAQIAGSLGISQAQAGLLISQYRLKLAGMGKAIAWLADDNGAGVFFYNPGVETTFSDRNVYWLERGSGLAMEPVGGGNAGPAAAGQSYKEALHFEGNRYALLGPYMDPLGDIWSWDYIEAGGGAKTFAIEVPSIAASGTARLTVTLQGATDTEAEYDHHAVISLNGTEIGNSFWGGTHAHSFEIAVDPSLLVAGANTISVSGALDMGAPYSIFYVESFDLSYQRDYRAVNNALICRGDGNPVITVTGFTEARVAVLDVSGPNRPKLVLGAAPDVTGRVTFVPRSAGDTYLLSGLNSALRPLAVVGDRPAQIKGQGNAAEYLVIAPEEFKDAAQVLADYRKSKGLTARVVTLEDIYETFNFGMPSPLAVRDFLAHAYANWETKKPKYAVLIGKGTYDYNDYLGYGDNLFPVVLAKTPEGLCAADRIFGDVVGKNGLPEIAVGRLPAVTDAELRAMIAKIKAYESGQGAWTDKAVMVADNPDEAGDFAAGSDRLTGLVTGFLPEKIHLSTSAAETRARILEAWNAGAALVNYVGHAGIGQWALENLFTAADAGALNNGDRLPLAAMFTCVAGRFELPGFTCLGEALMLNENGGMAGGLAPSGAGMHADSMRLGEEFYKAALRGKGMTAGQALLAAMKSYLQLGGPAYLLNIYNWLGDPAIAYK